MSTNGTQAERQREDMDRAEWFLREHGRRPTVDEVLALRELRPRRVNRRVAAPT